MDRDLNAALNIKAVGLHSVGKALEALGLKAEGSNHR
jgi:transposase